MKAEIEGDLLGQVDNLKYVYHGICDLAKFPDFAKEKYMEKNT